MKFCKLLYHIITGYRLCELTGCACPPEGCPSYRPIEAETPATNTTPQGAGTRSAGGTP